MDNRRNVEKSSSLSASIGNQSESSPIRSSNSLSHLRSQSPQSTQYGSQVVYTPRLKKVLKSYQASAITSLNGPDWVSSRLSSTLSSPSSSSSSVSSPLSSLPLISTPPISRTLNEMKAMPQLMTSTVNIIEQNNKLSENSDHLSRSSTSTTKSRFGEQSLHSSQSSQSSLNKSIKNRNIHNLNTSNDTKGENYDPFLAPPPFPIQQPPIFTPPDQNRCERSETILEGETISCFTVGGEKRLCLPQILTTVLREFSLPQINSVCDELQIFCSRCTIDQLEVLKLTGIIPVSAPSCGLITKTDAERLCAALLYSNPPKSTLSNTNGVNGKRLFTFKVYHECFGKCIGLYVPSLYVQPFSTCIECLECHGLFAPQKFVCHSHRSQENRTCHWGFDSSNWRAYLLLASEQQINQNINNDIKQHLIEMKARFDFKRKIPVTPRDENPICDPLKRLKCEESSSPSGVSPYSYPSYLFSPYGWATDPSLLMYWYPTLASGTTSNSSTTLAQQLSAFKPWSPSSIGKHLSQNISQVMSPGYSNLQTHKLSCEPPLLQNREKIASKRLDRYIEPNVSAPQISQNTTNSIAQKAYKELKASDKHKSTKDKVLYDDDSYHSNNTFSSENSNLSDEETTPSAKSNKSEKVFSNLEVILEENKLSQELKVKIMNEVENIIKKLANIETTNILHNKKLLNGIETNKTLSTSGRQSSECLGSITSSPLMPVVSCSPTLIKREPNSSPLLADPKINCVH